MPCCSVERGELRVVAGLDELVHVADHVVVERIAFALHVVALVEAEPEHVRVDRADDVELLLQA